MTYSPLKTFTFEAESLINDFPPQWRHSNKLKVWNKIRGSTVKWEGPIILKQWTARPIPTAPTGSLSFDVRLGAFSYAPSEQAMMKWHLNFADPVLFSAYDSSLLAQDELQVLEHPVLGSILEFLNHHNEPLRTLDRNCLHPTPVTITHVQRHCSLDTLNYPIYGNAFSRTSEAVIEQALTLLRPATRSHILAISALPGGIGTYSRQEIETMLVTAFTGFSAARAETLTDQGAEAMTEIHTGFWGCGAFGGNRTLMTILQGLAAAAAGVKLVFWATEPNGVVTAQKAFIECDQLLKDHQGLLHNIIPILDKKGFSWGQSDGN